MLFMFRVAWPNPKVCRIITVSLMYTDSKQLTGREDGATETTLSTSLVFKKTFERVQVNNITAKELVVFIKREKEKK